MEVGLLRVPPVSVAAKAMALDRVVKVEVLVLRSQVLLLSSVAVAQLQVLSSAKALPRFQRTAIVSAAVNVKERDLTGVMVTAGRPGIHR